MKTISKFTGFSPATFQFFAELEENNYKPWFDEHKPVYELEVLQPLKALANALVPFFANVDAQMDFRPVKMVSRIYRDIRFSHDKTPYKKHMWIAFQRPFQKQSEDWMSFPGFYAEVGKDGANYGMGLFEAKKKIMDRYRDQIAYEPDNFRKITAGLIEKHGFQIEGEEYKRPIANELDEDFQTWIQRKSIFVTKHVPITDLLYSEKFVPYMEKEFALVQPLYDFLTNICD
ncbi:TIGR02453 family protein [Bacteroidia bacterium]|nr:TIGR02453 family protein [Bacteroidia bacterium]